jgi:hypothetical protein
MQDQIEFKVDTQGRVVVTRTRKATRGERLRDPTAVDMVEVINIVFSNQHPVVHVNRDLCAADEGGG